MSTAYNLAYKVIVTKKKSKTYCLNLINVYFAAGQLSNDEYTELIALINATYSE